MRFPLCIIISMDVGSYIVELSWVNLRHYGENRITQQISWSSGTCSLGSPVPEVQELCCLSTHCDNMLSSAF